MTDDVFDEDDIGELDNLISEEPIAYCIFCDSPLFEPEELETGFCYGGECEENFHNQIEFK